MPTTLLHAAHALDATLEAALNSALPSSISAENTAQPPRTSHAVHPLASLRPRDVAAVAAAAAAFSAAADTAAATLRAAHSRGLCAAYRERAAVEGSAIALERGLKRGRLLMGSNTRNSGSPGRPIPLADLCAEIRADPAGNLPPLAEPAFLGPFGTREAGSPSPHLSRASAVPLSAAEAQAAVTAAGLAIYPYGNVLTVTGNVFVVDLTIAEGGADGVRNASERGAIAGENTNTGGNSSSGEHANPTGTNAAASNAAPAPPGITAVAFSYDFNSTQHTDAVVDSALLSALHAGDSAAFSAVLHELQALDALTLRSGVDAFAAVRKLASTIAAEPYGAFGCDFTVGAHRVRLGVEGMVTAQGGAATTSGSVAGNNVSAVGTLDVTEPKTEPKTDSKTTPLPTELKWCVIIDPPLAMGRNSVHDLGALSTAAHGLVSKPSTTIVGEIDSNPINTGEGETAPLNIGNSDLTSGNIGNPAENVFANPSQSAVFTRRTSLDTMQEIEQELDSAFSANNDGGALSSSVPIIPDHAADSRDSGVLAVPPDIAMTDAQHAQDPQPQDSTLSAPTLAPTRRHISASPRAPPGSVFLQELIYDPSLRNPVPASVDVPALGHTYTLSAPVARGYMCSHVNLSDENDITQIISVLSRQMKTNALLQTVVNRKLGTGASLSADEDGASVDVASASENAGDAHSSTETPSTSTALPTKVALKLTDTFIQLAFVPQNVPPQDAFLLAIRIDLDTLQLSLPPKEDGTNQTKQSLLACLHANAAKLQAVLDRTQDLTMIVYAVNKLANREG